LKPPTADGPKAVALKERSLCGEAGAMTPGTGVGSEPATSEGMRLIKAFCRVTHPHQRKRLIDQTEAKRR